MFSSIGKTIEDAKADADFYRYNTFKSKEDYEDWYNKSLIILQKHHPDMDPAEVKKQLDYFDIQHGLLYHYERPPSVFTEEEEELFATIKQKKIIESKK